VVAHGARRRMAVRARSRARASRRGQPGDGAAHHAGQAGRRDRLLPAGHRGLAMTVRIQTGDFDAGAEIAALRRGDPKVGAVASFIGVCRDANDGSSVSQMTLEHYPGMTEKAIEKIITEAKQRWNVADALVIHRVGTLKPTDQIVLVVVTGSHRGE